ncbi:hypothetical protein Y032_0295g1665 [Ancylostoma ceylanicum]|uniref:Uncharacterized protein n=1 Tax=Ancylostoma ceylanicum TaxID=53326 RepID=A0A016S578_9BILA|nr:hypothetical protein Y032_0295g1665 [Ancylostoma ceylanicum]
MPVSYIIFCPNKILHTMRNSPHRMHYVCLRNLAHRGKFSPTKKNSCEIPSMDAVLFFLKSLLTLVISNAIILLSKKEGS